MLLFGLPTAWLITLVKASEKENCTLFTLTNYDTLIRKALEEDYIREEDLEALKKWRENPEKWGI